MVFLRLNQAGLREASVKAFLTLFLLISLATEMMSIFAAIRSGVVTSLWWAVTVGSTALWLAVRWRFPKNLSISRHLDISLELTEWLGAGGVFLTLFATGLTAMVAAPNNWDSMTYHLPRVAEWIQNASLRFFPTSILRQNYQPPLAEFAILHLQLLAGSDRYANMVQWWSFVACLVLTSLIGRELGGSRAAQWIAMVFVASLPMAILQASSTQNDLVEAAFLLAFVFFLLRLARTSRTEDLVFCASALGMALQTKATGYIYCAPLILLLGSKYLLTERSARHLARGFARVLILSAIVVAVNASHYARSITTYGQLLFSGNEPYLNENFSGATFARNVVRNFGLHLATGYDRVDVFTMKSFRSALGSDLEDPSSTWPGGKFEVRYSRHEDTAGNPVHVVLCALALAVLLGIKFPQKSTVILLLAGIVGAFVLFCLLFRWQPWHSRLHLPLFVLSAPIVGIGLSQLVRGFRRSSLVFIGLVIASALPCAFLNESRPLLSADGMSIFQTSRLQQYFAGQPFLLDETSEITQAIMRENPTLLALDFGRDSWEYPLWILLNKTATRRAPEIRHAVSRQVLEGEKSALLLASKPLLNPTILSWGYQKIYETNHYLLLRPQSDGRP